MKTGFEDDHVPVTTLPRTVKSGPCLVSVWSMKTNTSHVRVLGDLTADAMVHFETNPKIEKISSYPTTLEFDDRDEKGFKFQDHHRPQLGIQYFPERGQNQGRIVYFDVIPYQRRVRSKKLKQRVERLKTEFRDRMHAGYGVIDETSIWVQPRFDNLSIMRWHLKAREEGKKDRVRAVLKELPVPTTIGEVRRAADIGSPWWIVGDKAVTYTRQLADIDYVFTALMQLAAAGEVRLDMSRHFDGDTAVTWTPRKGGFR